jgi:hypothetical protein
MYFPRLVHSLHPDRALYIIHHSATRNSRQRSNLPNLDEEAEDTAFPELGVDFDSAAHEFSETTGDEQA